jgi:MYXO-CTERM domain-containing protein
MRRQVAGCNRAAAAWLAVVVMGGAASPALGYVRRRTDDKLPEYWQASCVLATIYLDGFSMMTPDEVAKSIAAAAHAWSPSAITCSDGSHPYFEIVTTMAPAGEAPPPVQNDGRNSIIFRSVWPDGLAGAIAITSTFAKADGRILDEDMEINAAASTFTTWSNLDPGFTVDQSNGIQSYDLQNAVTHEFGHFIGLDHTCITDFTLDPPVDDLGRPVPNCGMAPPALAQTTMWPFTDRGELSQRFLSADELRAMCDIYPAARDPHVCTLDLPDDGCGCAAAGPAGNHSGHRPRDYPAAAWGAIALLGAWAVRRRRRRIL